MRLTSEQKRQAEADHKRFQDAVRKAQGWIGMAQVAESLGGNSSLAKFKAILH